MKSEIEWPKFWKWRSKTWVPILAILWWFLQLKRNFLIDWKDIVRFCQCLGDDNRTLFSIPLVRIQTRPRGWLLSESIKFGPPSFSISILSEWPGNVQKKKEVRKHSARCLKIREKVSFNIASEASYVYILSGQKFIKNA